MTPFLSVKDSARSRECGEQLPGVAGQACAAVADHGRATGPCGRGRCRGGQREHGPVEAVRPPDGVEGAAADPGLGHHHPGVAEGGDDSVAVREPVAGGPVGRRVFRDQIQASYQASAGLPSRPGVVVSAGAQYRQRHNGSPHRLIGVLPTGL